MIHPFASLSIGLCCLLLTARAACAQAPSLDPDAISRVVEQVEPSVVSILRVRLPANEAPAERIPETPALRGVTFGTVKR